MKKYVSLFLLSLFSLLLFSCDSNDNDDYDTYSVVYDVTDNFTAGTPYYISRTFNNAIPDSDVVLVYRLSATDNGASVWQLLPRTLYLDEGELDYDFDFTKYDVLIKAGGTIDLDNQSSSFKNAYLNNQTFRIVIVPASYGRSANGSGIDYSDYNSVIKTYGINDKNVKVLK